MIIACFDPGNHTGWVMDNNGDIVGGTFLEVSMYEQISRLFDEYPIDIVVYETFNLYPGMSKHLAWNSFYPVEIIGILKYECWRRGIKMIGQSPSIKKYAGTIDPEVVKYLKQEPPQEYFGKFTEHTKDALLHLMYFKRNNIEITRDFESNINI